ncbi:MAG: hypothetical protein ACP5GI_01060 [Sulfolobales archaeon]
MGTKGKKPLSAMEKKQLKEQLKEQKAAKTTKKEEKTTRRALVELEASLITRAKKELISLDYITPYQVKEKLGISYTLARKLLRYLNEEGSLHLYSGNRRIKIYVPAAK